ncbi:hypothetical protein EJ07DRAFT_172784 [Lizonia empirigonia]|nr:hypothetical protein EJ07DRAFT_172784 [Lizonia empirigonia]
MSDETPGERVSRFREHTNTNSSIRPPPDELWKDMGLEMLIDQFNDENARTPAVRKPAHLRQMMAARPPTTARTGSDAATGEGTLGRFSRVFASVFGSVLGKRKAGHSDAEPSISTAQAQLDERKRQAEEAYHAAKAQGLLPAPKVFVRPGTTPHAWSADSPARPRPPLTPRTPGSLARSPSKKDLHKQRKLSKRVSSLEIKLASARKELQSVLGHECFVASPTPAVDEVGSDAPPSPGAGLPGRITKKRKSTAVTPPPPPPLAPQARQTPRLTPHPPHAPRLPGQPALHALRRR